MPSVMEKPSAGSGILSRSRAKTAPNGAQPHSEDDSSEEEHSHGEPGGLGLKARWSGEETRKVGRGRVANHRWFLPLLNCSLCFLMLGGYRHRESTAWAAAHPPPLCPQLLREHIGCLTWMYWVPYTLPPCRGLRSDWARGWKDTSMRSCEAHVVGRSPGLPARMRFRSGGNPPSLHPPARTKHFALAWPLKLSS